LSRWLNGKVGWHPSRLLQCLAGCIRLSVHVFAMARSCLSVRNLEPCEQFCGGVFERRERHGFPHSVTLMQLRFAVINLRWACTRKSAPMLGAQEEGPL
jgi:hypothetical protein